MTRFATFSRLPATVVLAGLLAGLLAPRPAVAALPEETKEQKDQRMEWWRDGKFGMFIHWGLYAIPAGEWKGKKVPGIGEWIMNRAHIPVEEYEPLQKQFNPVKYDPQRWVEIAKRAGMKYIVITSKHHDGFCLFDSQYTDWDVMGTPYGKDLLKPLADACHDQGIQICWYHSIMDWHHPDAKGANFPKYEDHLKAQLKELLTNYGDIGVLWFDGEWIGEWNQEKGIELEKYIRGIQPDLIVNNRVGKRKQGSPGDFGTPEQHIPPTGIPGWDWETCMTMNNTWGFKKDDHNWKSVDDLLHKLVDIVSKGGNFLLNVGPTAEGEIPQASVERLEAIGRWMDTNGESIYGTTASPFKQLPWGRATKKPGRVYLHVFDWPADGKLLAPGLSNKVTGAYLLADAKKSPLKVTQTDRGVEVALPAEAPDPIDSVVVLQIEGEAEVAVPTTGQAADGSVVLHARDAVVHGPHARYEQGGGKDNIGFWTDAGDWVSWDFELKEPGTFEVEITLACPDQSAGSEYTLSVGGRELSAKVPATGGWATFTTEKIGRVELSQTGKLTLAVRPKTLVKEGVMNLQSVRLEPVK